MASDRWTAADLPVMSGQTAVVTGASSGIGAVTARELARAGARVVLAVRDVAKGRRVARTMAGDTEVRELKLDDLASVRAFASAWTGDLDILINNAGIMLAPEGRTGRLDLEDLNWQRRPYRPGQAYSDSKLANMLFTLDLQRRLTAAGSSVRALAVHPGMTRTNLFGHASGVQATLINALGRLVLQDPGHGARSTLFAATRDIPGGSFVEPDGFAHMRGSPQIAAPSRGAQDAAVARKLWGLSARLTGIGQGING